MTIFCCKPFILSMSDSQSYLQSLVSLRHWEDFVSSVDSAQFAERAEQPLTGPAIELQLLLVVLRTGQDLEKRGTLNQK